jgi:hypothetical protein
MTTAAERNIAFAKARGEAEQTLARLSELKVASCDTGAYIKRASDHFDPSQPRDDHGRWTDGGGSDDAAAGKDEGSGRPEAASAAATSAGASADKLTGAFSSRSASDAEFSRNVASVFELDAGGRADARELGYTPQSFQELQPGTNGGAARFHAAITAAKAGKYAAAVNVYAPDDYKGMRLFLTADDKIGFALKGNDIVSCFKSPDTTAQGAAHVMLALAVQQGGRKLDAFDTVLPELYSKNGFRAASRLAWDESQKPAGWDKETFKAFNGGQPDVVFMVYDPGHVNASGLYKKTDGIRVNSYDDAVAVQDGFLRKEDQPPKPPRAGMSEQEVHKAVVQVSKDMGFDPAAIYIDNGEPSKFELNGKQYQAAGLAYTNKIGKDALLITLYSKNTSPASVDGVIAHEIEHIKYETAINRYNAERAKVIAEVPPEGGMDQVMRADGSLKPPYDQKYPAYTAMHEAYYGRQSFTDFAAADGVSDYSYDWWLNWKEGSDRGTPSASRSAVHETLAEMARVKYETGKFPDHMGERILSWRGPDTPKPSQAQMDANAKVWRDLYRAVDKVWKLPG